ncbi:MAG: decaprenyl-phosphate phosphoribosyltransferase [Anaerolineae bacterium]|nr:decaprenyl-phosphate phosphoribosyltransferase [Anaerolineae bacterium]
MIIDLIKAMRPKQWVKNVVVFAPLLFDVKLFNLQYSVKAFFGFVLLCLISGTVYLINDVVDVEKDRQHPKKRLRPIASGELGTGAATVAAIVLPLIGLPAGFILDPTFGALLAGYLTLQIAYSFVLKHLVILDVLAIAAGFVLRVAAGVPLVRAARFSPWLFVCMTFLALLFGFGKRRHELILLKEDANSHRQSLDEYNIQLLDHSLSIVTASTLLAYALYTFSAVNLPANHSMMLTIPFVLYAVFRYLYLIHVKGMGGAPEDIAFSDRPLQITIMMWALTVVVIMYAQ